MARMPKQYLFLNTKEHNQGRNVNSIFNYQSIDADLSRSTRTLFITFKKTHIDWETLFELESILAWSTDKVEIKSIYLRGCHQSFGKGIHPQSLKKMGPEKIKQFTRKLHKITKALPCMAQTIICDLGFGAENLSAELALACDIRVSHLNAKLSFNHSHFGLVPCSGAISTLGHIVGVSHAKNWLMSCEEINCKTLLHSGFIYKAYDQTSLLETQNNLLTNIFKQADVARIQSKLGLSENYREHAEKLNQFAIKLANAALTTEDWKNIEQEDTMPAKHFSTAVKLSLIKNDSELV